MTFREVNKVPYRQILFIKPFSSSAKVLIWFQFISLMTFVCLATDEFWNEFPESQRMPETSAKEYLSKFGWVKPSVWSELSPSLRQLLLYKTPTEHSFTTSKSEYSKNKITTYDFIQIIGSSNTQKLSEARYIEALKDFQNENGLQVNGILDEATSLVMQQPRCGVPDKTTTTKIKKNKTETILEYSMKLNPTKYDYIVNESLVKKLDNKTKLRSKREVYEYNKTTFKERNIDDSNRIKQLNIELEQLRKIWANEKEKKPNEKISMIDRLVKVTSFNQQVKIRKKRSDLFKLVEGHVTRKNTITWRLSKNWPSTNPYMTMNEVWFTLRLAFRMWSEVLPTFFHESPSSEGSDEYVDILLGFAFGQHNECPATFNTAPFVREYAHAWPLPWAQVHFNDNEMFVPFSWSSNHKNIVLQTNKLPISLLKVALHEIGHALGLKHSNNRSSIMYPFYKPFQNQEIVELSDADRKMVRQLYGNCKTIIDAMFDVVFVQKNKKNEYFLKYNTFIFRKGYFWMYKNQVRRPVYGYPKMITKYWRGLLPSPGNYHKGIDAVVQTRENNIFRTLFFFGEYYAEYDMSQERVKATDANGFRFPRKISEAFKTKYGPKIKTVDAALYKFNEKLIYLFKDNLVWRYRWPSKTLYDTSLIQSLFPIINDKPQLRKWSDQVRRVSAAYYSLTDDSYYLMWGNRYWKVDSNASKQLSTQTYYRNGRRIIRYVNPVSSPRLIASKWLHVCDVGQEEINMSLP